MRLLSSALIALSPLLFAGASLAQGTSNTYTTVNPYTGTITRTTVTHPKAPAGIAGMLANQNIYGSTFPGASTNTTVTLGSNHRHPFPPAPNYPYPYPVPVYSLPGQAYSGPIFPKNHDWEKPNWITSIPLGTTYYGYQPPVGPYPFPAYPYPAYPYPIGIPVPVCQPTCAIQSCGGHNHGYASYPGYPAYGTYSNRTTTGGYGIRAGGNGLSINLGQRTTTTTRSATPFLGSGTLTTSSTYSSGLR